MSDTGWKSPGTVVDDDTRGTTAWSNPSNATVSDGMYATVYVPSAESHYLKATNFGFSIPTGATINGILVETQIKSDTSQGNSFRAMIIKGGTFVGTYKISAYEINTTLKYMPIPTSGGATDLWDQSWTADDINASTFGVGIYDLYTSNCTLQVDHIRIKVYYTEGGTEANSERKLYVKGGDFYSRESTTDLESDDTPLATTFSEQDYTDVESDDNVYVDLQGTARYMKFLFKEFNENESNTQKFTITWKGKSSVAPSSHTVYLQIYNRTTSTWTNLTSNNSASANTKFTLTYDVTTGMSDYYDANHVISARIYQDVVV